MLRLCRAQIEWVEHVLHFVGDTGRVQFTDPRLAVPDLLVLTRGGFARGVEDTYRPLARHVEIECHAKLELGGRLGLGQIHHDRFADDAVGDDQHRVLGRLQISAAPIDLGDAARNGGCARSTDEHDEIVDREALVEIEGDAGEGVGDQAFEREAGNQANDAGGGDRTGHRYLEQCPRHADPGRDIDQPVGDLDQQLRGMLARLPPDLVPAQHLNEPRREYPSSRPSHDVQREPGMVRVHTSCVGKLRVEAELNRQQRDDQSRHQNGNRATGNALHSNNSFPGACATALRRCAERASGQFRHQQKPTRRREIQSQWRKGLCIHINNAAAGRGKKRSDRNPCSHQ